jgi:hypothetical protein
MQICLLIRDDNVYVFAIIGTLPLNPPNTVRMREVPALGFTLEAASSYVKIKLGF